MKRLRCLVALAAPVLSPLALGCAPDDSDPPSDLERIAEAPAALSQALEPEDEPNGAALNATPISKNGVIGANIFGNGDDDFFSGIELRNPGIFRPSIRRFKVAGDCITEWPG